MFKDARARRNGAQGEPGGARCSQRKTGQGQRGVAAVEFAVLLPILITLLTFPILFGRIFMNYSVIHKAAHDAAIYFATIPVSEIRDVKIALQAVEVSNKIIELETEGIGSGSGGPPVASVYCDGLPCGANLKPNKISVHVRMVIFDDFFNDFTYILVGTEGTVIRADITVPYIGV